MLEPAAESDIPAIVALLSAAFRGTDGERSWNHEDFIVGEAMPFPDEDSRFGRPLRDDLAFVMIEKRL